MRIDDYQGVSTKTPPAKLPPYVFQEDKGSDRFSRKAWKRRRGMRHTDIAKKTSAVVSILGFELPGGVYATLLVEGTNVHGFDGVGQE